MAQPTVLVIDDDEMVRRAVVRGLRRTYAVSEANSAEDALAAIAGGARYDAIVCDLHLGGMSGRQFVVDLQGFDAEQSRRVVILSGSSRGLLDDAFLDSVRFVEKPATVAEIDRALREILVVEACAA